MPLIGNYLASIINIDIGYFSKYILAIIFFILGIEVLTEKDSLKDKINFLSLIIISISVSIDSLTIGVGLSLADEYSILGSIIFSITSILFTLIGLFLGKYLNKYINNRKNIIGALILFILSIKYLL